MPSQYGKDQAFENNNNNSKRTRNEIKEQFKLGRC
jgi:hypothetical protein